MKAAIGVFDSSFFIHLDFLFIGRRGFIGSILAMGDYSRIFTDLTSRSWASAV